MKLRLKTKTITKNTLRGKAVFRTMLKPSPMEMITMSIRFYKIMDLNNSLSKLSLICLWKNIKSKSFYPAKFFTVLFPTE